MTPRGGGGVYRRRERIRVRRHVGTLTQGGLHAMADDDDDEKDATCVASATS